MRGLAHLRVVDFSSQIAGPYCTKLLADAGADVIKVEDSAGDPLRRWSATGANLGGEDGALFRFLNASKRSIVGRPDAADVQELIRGADLVVETVGGHAPTLSQAIEILRSGCTAVVLGLFDADVPIDTWSAVLKDARLLFSFTYGLTGKRHDFELCLEWMASGLVPAQELVTHVRPLAEIAEAFELAADKSRGVIKVVLNP